MAFGNNHKKRGVSRDAAAFQLAMTAVDLARACCFATFIQNLASFIDDSDDSTAKHYGIMHA